MAKLLLNKVTGQMVAVYAEHALITPDILEEGVLNVADGNVVLDLTALTDHAKKVLADDLNATKPLGIGTIYDLTSGTDVVELILPTELDNYIVLADTRSQASRDIINSNVSTADLFTANMDYFPVDDAPADDGGEDDGSPK